MITEAPNFLLRDDIHTVEFISPFRFAGRAKGALIVAFDRREVGRRHVAGLTGGAR